MKKMKKIQLIMIAFSIVLFVSSCSDDHAEHGCQECHLAMENPNFVDEVTTPDEPDHLMWDIVDADGEHIDFCNESLELMEDEVNWRYTIPEGHYLLEDHTGDTLFAGTYTAADGYESHCDKH